MIEQGVDAAQSRVEIAVRLEEQGATVILTAGDGLGEVCVGQDVEGLDPHGDQVDVALFDQLFYRIEFCGDGADVHPVPFACDGCEVGESFALAQEKVA